MNHNVIGLDIAKNVFHCYSLGADNKAVKQKLKRADLLTFFANHHPSLIGIEACGGAHYWARELTKLGHQHVAWAERREARVEYCYTFNQK